MERPSHKLDVLNEIDVDDNVLAELPKGTRITSTAGHGASFWTQTARIDTELPDGTHRAYFLKMAQDDAGRNGRDMMHGEFESAQAMYKAAPNFTIHPIAWGTFKSDPTKHFYLCDFHDIVDELPDVTKFCKGLAQMHLNSMPQSPNGKFGFHVTTCVGTVPQDNAWSDSWEEFFTRTFKHHMAFEATIQGPQPQEMIDLAKAMVEKVIPRLLRPLEIEGRKVTPCIIHGDLWSGNTSMHAETDEPIVFDASAFWGHNEYDPAQWRVVRTNFGRDYVYEYHKYFPIAQPEEDWDDRCALYSIRYNLHSSSLYRSRGNRNRNMVIDEMKRLVEKYPNGFEGTPTRVTSPLSGVPKLA